MHGHARAIGLDIVMRGEVKFLLMEDIPRIVFLHHFMDRIARSLGMPQQDLRRGHQPAALGEIGGVDVDCIGARLIRHRDFKRIPAGDKHLHPCIDQGVHLRDGGFGLYNLRALGLGQVNNTRVEVEDIIAVKNKERRHLMTLFQQLFHRSIKKVISEKGKFHTEKYAGLGDARQAKPSHQRRRGGRQNSPPPLQRPPHSRGMLSPP